MLSEINNDRSSKQSQIVYIILRTHGWTHTKSSTYGISIDGLKGVLSMYTVTTLFTNYILLKFKIKLSKKNINSQYIKIYVRVCIQKKEKRKEG